jgi:hypothetical protein
MSRKILVQVLTETERHLARCVADIDRQRSMIAEMDRMGQDSTEALAVLKTLQQIQALRIHHREHILGELIQ